MSQKSITSIGLSQEVKSELESRKKVLSRQIGRSVSFDEIIRTLLGWRIV